MLLRVGELEFGYDRAGEGEPVMLVMGLGTPRIGWFHQFGFLSLRGYDVVSFDNRGCGETKCESQWTVEDMAADVVAIADAFGFETFHLVGISMGGMISQEAALAYPDRIRTLTLMATTPGGPESVPMTPEYMAAMMLPDPVERMRKSIELTFGEKYRTENPEMMKVIIDAATGGTVDGLIPIGAEGIGTAGFFTQVMAVVNWMAAGGAADRLKEIDKPTLVIHGGDDHLLPLPNGEILARDIPGARFRVWPHAGHALTHEYADEVNTELLGHLLGARV
jgi:3-oxoadipate enol-lactonase